jgi:outer membrane protein assembly factor BamA
LYEPSFSHPDDSVWVTGGVAFYSENESIGGGVFHKMSLGGDQWRMSAAAFTADLRYDYFGIGGAPDFRIPLKQQMDLLLGEALYRVRPNLYLGLQAVTARTNTGIDLPPDLLPPDIPPLDLSLDIDLVSLAPKLQFDTRDNPFYPRKGWLIEGALGISRKDLGGDVDYQRHDWAVNHYLAVTDRATLAFRGAAQYVGGDAPFFLYPAFGQGSDLRGYQTGTYRDRFLFAAQAEWRQRLSPRWGAVAFAGLGTVSPDFGGWDETLPSAGVGLRWVAAPKNNLSVRVDVAWGKDDSEFYVSIGEAF